MLLVGLTVYRELFDSNYIWFIIPCIATPPLCRIGVGTPRLDLTKFAIVYAVLSEALVLASFVYLIGMRLATGPGYLHLDLLSNGAFLFFLVLGCHAFLLLVGGVLIVMLFDEYEERKKRVANKML